MKPTLFGHLQRYRGDAKVQAKLAGILTQWRRNIIGIAHIRDTYEIMPGVNARRIYPP